MNPIIKCPSCDYEYLPGEIYLPEQFLGKPKNVERTIEGRIDTNYGTDMNLKEIYTCDKCGKAFKVSANVSFTTEVDVTRNFDDDFITDLYKDRIVLKED